MAIFKPGSLVQAVSGRIGGIVFQRGPGGAYISRAPRRVKRSSVQMVRAQGMWQKWRDGWNGLTEDRRKQWDAYAAELTRMNRVGTVKHVTGRQAYVSWYAFDRWNPVYAESIGQTPWALYTPYPASVFWVDFSVGGPFWVHVEPWFFFLPGIYTGVWVGRVPQHDERMPRSWRWVGAKAQTAASVNFRDVFDAAGITFIEGEFVCVKARSLVGRYWPSAPVYGWSEVWP